MLNDNDLATFKRQLLRQREELLALKATGDEAAKTVELDQARVGRLSRMDALQDQAMSIATQQRREAGLKKIAAALSRMDAGEYGYCASCEEAIDVKRLALDPTAVQCIACANQSEQD
ncbi:MAG: TraR/DksA family transcriptional regulator [Gammaproteobacteria bacterium]